MRLLNFKFKNLFSLGSGEINLQSRGLTLITGYSEDEGSQNGAGKSSLANKAILWTLFGETAGGLRADSVLNRHGKRKGFGEISFEGINSKQYKIIRERPAKLTLEYLSNGEWKDLSASTVKATQLLIDKMLGFDFKTFIQTSVFGQGRSIHYPSLTPKEQKAILEQILPMEEIDHWAVYADKQVKTLNPKLKELELNLKEITGRTAELSRQLNICEEDGIKFEEDKKEKIKNAEIALTKVREPFEKELEQLNIAQNYRGVNVETITNRINDLKIEINSHSEEYKKVQLRWSAANLSEREWLVQLNSLKRRKAEINTDTKCPVCLRDYDKSTIETMNSQLLKQEKLIATALKTIGQCKTARTYYDQEMKIHQEKIDKINENISSLEKQLDEAKDCEQKKQLIEERIKAASTAVKTELELAINSENPYVQTFKRLEEDLEQLNIQLEVHQEQYSTFKDELEHLLYWKDIYGKELKLKLFEDVCPFLDAQTDYHLSQLQNPQIHCEFSTIKRLASGDVKEEFNVNVWSETGGQGFDSLSGGEQQMVSFSIGLALADLARRVTNSKSGFLILDEPLTELDSRNSEAVVEYLTSEIENGRDTIFLISNEESLKGLIHNRIHIIKSKGISNVDCS